MSEYTLDARNLLCPLPVIRTQNAIMHYESGDILTVIATDPGTLHDIPAWCRIHGHEVITTKQDDLEIEFQIRVGSDG